MPVGDRIAEQPAHHHHQQQQGGAAKQHCPERQQHSRAAQADVEKQVEHDQGGDGGCHGQAGDDRFNPPQRAVGEDVPGRDKRDQAPDQHQPDLERGHGKDARHRVRQHQLRDLGELAALFRGDDRNQELAQQQSEPDQGQCEAQKIVREPVHGTSLGWKLPRNNGPEVPICIPWCCRGWPRVSRDAPQGP